jgi:hypothetical protein
LRQMPHDPIEVVELDELHGRVCKETPKKGSPASSPLPSRTPPGRSILDAVAAWVETGFMRRWRANRDS